MFRAKTCIYLYMRVCVSICECGRDVWGCWMCVPPLGSDCPIGTAGTMSSPNQQRRMIVNGSLVFEFGIDYRRD